MIWNYSVVDLSQNEELLKVLLEGQKLALSKYGLEDAILTQADLLAEPGTFAITANLPTGEIIAGLRIYTRTHNRLLPLECEGSYLPSEYRGIISKESNLCELRGLWVSPDFSGQTLGIQISKYAVSHCYSLGYSSIVGTGQMRTFKYLGEPIGFQREMSIPPFPYPDERFDTIVAWHRKSFEESFLVEN